MEQLFIQLCMMTSLSFNTLPQDACNKTILAAYTGSYFKSEFDAVRDYEEKKYNNFIKDDVVARDIVFGTTGMVYLINSYQNKDFRMTTDIQPIAKTITIEFTPISQYYLLEWAWQF